MRLAHAALLLLLLLLAAGCASTQSGGPVVPKPEVVETQPATQSTARIPARATAPPVPAAAPAPIAQPPTQRTESKDAARDTKTPAAGTKPSDTRASGPAAAKPAAPPAAAAPAPAAPVALDLNALKEQLKDTKAIGAFTKLSLKNQVDDLLQQFRDYYQGRAKITMAQLRRSYDVLLMKVLSLLQDADQKLASAIVSSREAIWGMLADPKKFSTLDV
jgi:hypothetical protein